MYFKKKKTENCTHIMGERENQKVGNWSQVEKLKHVENNKIRKYKHNIQDQQDTMKRSNLLINDKERGDLHTEDIEIISIKL